MKIRISKIAYVYAKGNFGGGNSELRNFLMNNVGKWLDVETKHMFDTQYNTEKYRIYDTMIDKIEDDTRTSNDIAFVSWGGEKPKVKEIEEGTKFGTYELESYEDLEMYRLRNARKRIDFLYHDGFYWVTLGIGYTKTKKLDIPYRDFKKLDKFFKELHQEQE